MTAIGVQPRAGAPPKPGGSPPFGKRLPLLEQGVVHSPRFGNRCFGYVLDPGKTTRVLSIARQVVTQRRPNAKVLPIPAQKTEALHCTAGGNLRVCAPASCKARGQLWPTQVACNRLAQPLGGTTRSLALVGVFEAGPGIQGCVWHTGKTRLNLQ